jgi:hypothetical protein
MKKLLFIVPVLLIAFAFSPAQLLKTGLRITILDELGNVQPNAKVVLYPSLEDYRQETNAIASSETDKKGIAKFTDLEPKVYYVNASKDDKNNIGAGVQTDTLKEGRINKVNIVIE